VFFSRSNIRCLKRPTKHTGVDVSRPTTRKRRVLRPHLTSSPSWPASGRLGA
jgi:hypothetical protein